MVKVATSFLLCDDLLLCTYILVMSILLLESFLSLELMSSLYSSPGTSIGSIKLSPVRKKRLVCKEVLSSADGQTKLFFE